MLDSIRKRKDNLVYTLIVLAVIAVMGLYGIGQMGNNDGRNKGPVAYVNGEAIPGVEFQEELSARARRIQAQLGAQYSEQLLMQYRIPDQVLEDLIQFKLIAQQATKLGIVVPDRELAEFIRSLPIYQKDGKFDAQGYSKLMNRGLEERKWRERLQLQRFQQYLMGRAKATPADIEAAHKLKDTKVDLEFAKIDFNSIAAAQKPSSEQVARTLKETSEDELKGYYESHIKEFSTPESRLIRQIRVGIPFKATETQRADAKKKIEAIAAEATPAEFGKVAIAKSDDEYAKKGGLVGWVAKGTLEDPLERALDTLAPGSVSKPIETQFGYFLLKLDEKKAEIVEPFEKTKNRIGEKLAAEKSKKEFGENLRKQWEEALAAGKSIEPELKKYRIDLKKTGPFSVGSGYIPQIGTSDAIVDAVFSLSKQNPVGKKLYYDQNYYYYVKLNSVEQPKAGTLEKDREVIERGALSALQSQIMQEWMADLQKQATIKKELNFGPPPGLETQQM